MSKGSRPRPMSIPLNEFNDKLDAIFGVKPNKERWIPPPLPGVQEAAESAFYDDEKVNLNIEFKTVSSEEPEHNVKDSTQGG